MATRNARDLLGDGALDRLGEEGDGDRDRAAAARRGGRPSARRRRRRCRSATAIVFKGRKKRRLRRAAGARGRRPLGSCPLGPDRGRHPGARHAGARHAVRGTGTPVRLGGSPPVVVTPIPRSHGDRHFVSAPLGAAGDPPSSRAPHPTPTRIDCRQAISGLGQGESPHGPNQRVSGRRRKKKAQKATKGRRRAPLRAGRPRLTPGAAAPGRRCRAPAAGASCRQRARQARPGPCSPRRRPRARSSRRASARSPPRR